MSGRHGLAFVSVPTGRKETYLSKDRTSVVISDIFSLTTGPLGPIKSRTIEKPLRFISDIIDYLYQITRPRKRKHSDTIIIDDESPTPNPNQPTKLMLSVPSLYTGLYQPKDDRDNIETPNYRKFEREYTADKILGKGGFGLVFQGMLKGLKWGASSR